MNKQLAEKNIKIELAEDWCSEEVDRHNYDLLEAIEKDDYKGMKVLVFQPIAIGDVMVSSLCAELFQIKFPGCTVDYFTEFNANFHAIRNNPFINKVIVDKDWELFRQRNSHADGVLKKQYDLAYSLYWWTKPNLISSFMEDLELPTEYTRLKLYRNFEYEEEIHKKYPKTGFRIAVQDQNDLKAKWDNGYEKLIEGLKKLGEVIFVGPSLEQPYDYTIEVLRQSDIFVGAHGSLDHAAAAVGCQSISLSTIYDPNWVTPQSYQNKYVPDYRPHISVRPLDWCKDYHCIDYCNKTKSFEHPPYGFSSEPKCAPHKIYKCNYKNFEKSCIHEITAEYWLKVIEEAIEERNKR